MPPPVVMTQVRRPTPLYWNWFIMLVGSLWSASQPRLL